MFNTTSAPIFVNYLSYLGGVIFLHSFLLLMNCNEAIETNDE